jgi:hypothetical protein
MMKLPEEHGLQDLSGVVNGVVKDCAEFAFKFAWNSYKDPNTAIKRELLARYGVKEESDHGR